MTMMWKQPRLCTLAIALSLTAGLTACGQDELASVDGRPVTKAEFDAYLKFKRLAVTEKETDRYESVLSQYLERTALASAIEDEIEDSDKIDGALIAAELEDFRKESLIARYFEQYLKDAVPQDAVIQYYNAHAQEFSEKRVHAAHILVRLNRAMTEPERKARLTKVQEAVAKLRTGADFAKVAEAYSEDSISAKKGGDLGWLREGAIDARFSEVAFGLEVGQVSEPFETPFGFHVVKVLEAPEVKTQPLEAVQGDIRYRLRNEAKEAELKRLLAEADIDR